MGLGNHTICHPHVHCGFPGGILSPQTCSFLIRSYFCYMAFVQRLMHHRLLLTLMLTSSLFSVYGQSVLSNGDWYKVGVVKTDLYKLDHSFLRTLGLPTNSLDPRTIKVYGYGGGMLAQENAEPRPFDLEENHIQAFGDSDGSFDAGDYFLFYGQSPDRIDWSETGLSYEKNFYSDTTYYFITFGGENGARVSSIPSEISQSAKITTYEDAIIHETETRNLLRSGRRWFGENMSTAAGLTTSFSFTRANVNSLESISVTAMAQSEQPCSLSVSVEGQLAGSIDLESIPFGVGSTYSPKGKENTEIFDVSGSDNTISVDFNFNPNGKTSIGYIDHFELTLKRNLVFGNQPLFTRSIESLDNPISTYQIQGTSSGMSVWDITNPTEAQVIQHELNGDIAEFSTSSNVLKEFVIFKGSDFSSPSAFGQMPNQSIKTLTAVDGVIVTHPLFLNEAKRLANFRSVNDNLEVAVVTIGQVYNEFSSGRQDVTAIRDYAKYVFDNGNRLKYLLLFGDASFSYKQKEFTNTNFVPIYQSRESFNPIFSHSSDDYFGFLEDNEGVWEESASGDHTMEIGVGRIPTKTIDEAETAVDKIIRYSTSTNTLGRWRNEITYIVDDGDANIHVQQAEDLIAILEGNVGFNPRKLYLDAFDQEIYPSNERAPTFTRAIRASIEEGSLFVNYLGHGDESLWMDEQVLTIEDIEELTNYQKLPIFVTATCEFGRYDDPFQFSGAEQLLLLNQGAIALLTTTRPVYAHTNLVLNKAYHQSILQAGPGKDVRLGDIIKDTKNNGLQGRVNRNFALLGDPMIRPSYPRNEIVLDQFQGNDPDTLSALSMQTITGKIMDGESMMTSFNGQVDIILFDIPVDKITKGQQSDTFYYKERSNILFRGSASVTNGAFSHQFILPKNISYKNQAGKLSLYAWSEELNADAGGGSEHLVIGGTNKDAKVDTTTPSLRVYLNEPNFKNGSSVGSGAMLIAKFADESGINISSLGFDRGITLDLNGEIIELNDFYSADLDDFTQGTVLYPLKDLASGRYTAIIKGADSYNNPVEKSVEFVVSSQPILQTYNFITYPNPTSTFTNFQFEHDREGEPLIIDLIIYSLNGEQAFGRRIETDFSSRNETIKFEWPEHQMKDGLYAFKLTIASDSDGAQKEHFGRLVIRN